MVNRAVEDGIVFDRSDVESFPSEDQRPYVRDHCDVEEGSIGGGDGGSALTDVLVPGDIGWMGNRNTSALGRSFARRPRIPAVLEPRDREVDVTSNGSGGDSEDADGVPGSRRKQIVS
jgi:hypothetical protein